MGIFFVFDGIYNPMWGPKGAYRGIPLNGDCNRELMIR